MKKITWFHPGKKFGKLTSIRILPPTKISRQSKILCVCECGTFATADPQALKSGRKVDCGCDYSKNMRNNAVKHGLSHRPEHMVWSRMLARCNNPNDCNFEYYGGKGIRVCERWLSFENFFADMGERPKGVGVNGRAVWSIERKNVLGDYEPGNCHWATTKEQNNNKTNTRLYTVEGVTQSLRAQADRFRISVPAVEARINRGWAEEDAFTVPPLPRGTRVHRKEDLERFHELTSSYSPSDVMILMDINEAQFANASMEVYGFVMKG